MNVGSQVKFSKPESNEVNDRFVVVEMRGDRVLVSDNSGHRDWSIVPTFVYLVSDLVVA